MAVLGKSMTLQEFSQVEREIAASQRRMQEEKPLPLRTCEALERIADVLEARNAIDGQMAAFAELLQQGAPQVEHSATNPNLAPDGLPWGTR